MSRVRKIPLLNSIFAGLFVGSGYSWDRLSAILSERLELPGLRYTHNSPFGMNTMVYVEHESFDEVGCCWANPASTKVPNWPEAAVLIQGISGGCEGTTPEAGPGTAAPEPQGGTP